MVPITVSSRGDASAALPVALRQLAPAVVEPVFNVDGTPNRFDRPADWGSTITIFLTGTGHYTPLIEDGQPAPLDAAHSLAAPVSVGFQIAGPDAAPAAGPAPGYVGLAQINVRLLAARPFPFSSIGPVVTIGGVPLFVPAIWVK